MNLFGMKAGGQKRNPLLGLLQPSLMEALGPGGGGEGESPMPLKGQEPYAQVQGPGFQGPTLEMAPPPQYQPHLMANPFAPGASEIPAPKDPAMTKPGPAASGLKDFMTSPLWGDTPMMMTKGEQGKLYDWLNSPQWFVPPKGGYVPGSGEEPTELPKSMAPAAPTWTPSSKATPPESPEPSMNLLTTEEKEKNLDTGMGGGLMSGALGATQDLLTKYGKAAQSMEGAKAALKKEFQDTPELDQIIAATQQELAQTRNNRKQPGIGEFLTMALLNLSGMHPRQSADMVLGLGDQKADETRLEDRLAQLEGGRATAKMQGRHEMRAMERQDKYQALQNALRQQETARKQGNEDREFGFKNQKLGIDKLMQRIGQLSQGVPLESDPSRKKKLQDEIDRLDPYGKLQQQMRSQQQTPVKDDRQSRMFGDLIGGGGYA